VYILLADRTVAAGYLLHALVRPLQVVRQAHVAPVTVEIVATPSNPTYTAALAVELLLVFVVVQFALVAEILSKLEVAFAAVLCDALPLPALRALHHGHVLPLQRMILVLVVAEPAPVHPVAAGRHKFTFPFVVRAGVVFRTGSFTRLLILDFHDEFIT